MSFVIGVDVGGTNTDVAIIDGENVVGWNKSSTTSNITDGVVACIARAFESAERNGYANVRKEIGRISIGTTHFINAVIKRTGLSKVACLRLCGVKSQSLPPFSDFPTDLKKKVDGGYYLTSGGFEFDGRTITEVNEEEIVGIVKKIQENGIRHIAVCGVFSPVDNSQEHFVESLLRKHTSDDVTWTLSSDLGYLGILERENATILNESLKGLCKKTISGFRKALSDIGLHCPVFFTQNDGTLISEKQTLEYPVYTFSSGATNSMRGAVHLSSVKDAIVVDIGGTSTDVGVLVNGFPREASTRVKVAGVNTNFRVPDTKSIGIGGGSFVIQKEDKTITVGPGSVEYRLYAEALVFGGSTMVASDVAVAAGYAELGDKTRVAHLTREFAVKTMAVIKEKIEEAVDSMKLSKESYPVVLVGGGSILIDVEKPFVGASEIIKPKFYQVANAVGAALSQVSGTYDKLVDMTTDHSRVAAIETAKQYAIDEAVRNGALRETCTILDVVEVHMSYVAVHRKRLKVKAVGNLHQHKCTPETSAQVKGAATDVISVVVDKCEDSQIVKDKEAPTAAVNAQAEQTETTPVDDISTYTPTVNAKGEWELSRFDVECLTLGVGVLGCGGGGSPYLGRLELLACMDEGYQPKVINPKSFKEGLAYGTAYMGAPEILYERLSTKEQLSTVLHVAQQLSKLGFKPGQSLAEIKDIASKNNMSIVSGADENYVAINYKLSPSIKNTQPAAILVLEIGGMNSLGPLTVGARLDVPVLDCDGMGRAFPQLQQFLPFICGCAAYPAALSDNYGNTVCCLKADSATELENFFRTECIKSGCASSISVSGYGKDDIQSKMCQNTLTQAWRIGFSMLKARLKHARIVDAILEECNGVCVGVGKICDLEKQTKDGFTKGRVFIECIEVFSGAVIVVDFQNEYLIVKREQQQASSELLASTPDLITLVETDTGEPIQPTELKYGVRVSVLVLPTHPLMKTERALKFVGPTAFGYEDAVYKSVGVYRQVQSNALVID